MFKLDFRRNYDNAIFPLCEVVRHRSYRFRRGGYHFTGYETWYDFKEEFKHWIEKVGPARAAKMLNEVA